MAIFVRPADLHTDRSVLIEALSQCLLPQSDGRRFDWLYRECPHGEARVWIASDGNGSGILGAAAVFPRRMFVGGEIRVGCVLGDFFVMPHFRSLGPAVLLQRACLDAVGSNGLDICYDFPAGAMIPVYKRLAIESQKQFVRLAKPFRVNQTVQARVKTRWLAQGLSAISNQILDSRDRRRRQLSDCNLSLHSGLCDDEFTLLARAVSVGYGVCVERSAEYLNWRYRNHFARSYELLTARRGDALLAYAVFTHDAGNAEIVDLFGVQEPAVLSDVISGVVALLRQRNVMTLSAPMLSSHTHVSLFESLGFYKRETCPVIVYPPRSHAAGESDERDEWFLMQGDRES
jgi:GNAT superfamily N-acetyltransferase